MSCFINGSLFTQVLPLCRCWTFLKANESPGFRNCCSSLWTCAPGAGGPLCEVFCMGSAFACTGSACFDDAVVITGVKGVVVLKGVAGLETVGVVLESYWLCTALYLFHMSFNIWNTLDVPFDVLVTVPSPVFTLDMPYDVPFNVLFPVLPPLILLK